MERIKCLNLSPREKEISKLIAWGFSQKEVAAKLNISVLTVNSHLKNIYRELDIHNVADLTRCFFFDEYCIPDNPFKKVLAVFFLAISFSMVMTEESTVRVFRSTPLRTSVRAVSPIREKKYENVFELAIS